VTLTITAPSSAGPHAWAIAWYGNAERDITLGYSLRSAVAPAAAAWPLVFLTLLAARRLRRLDV